VVTIYSIQYKSHIASSKNNVMPDFKLHKNSLSMLAVGLQASVLVSLVIFLSL